MNKLLQLAAYAAIATTFALSAKGQTTTNSFPPFDIPTSIQNLYLAIGNSSIAQATNWAVAPYVTYSPSTANKVGGGVLAVYNVPQLTGSLGAIGTALGADWLGGWSIVSGNLTIQTDIHPLETVSWLAFLPTTIRNVTMTPIALAGIGQPMSGGGGAATIWDVGDQIKFGHFLGGRFGVGATWGEWSNAGKQSGHRYHGFLDYQWGF